MNTINYFNTENLWFCGYYMICNIFIIPYIKYFAFNNTLLLIIDKNNTERKKNIKKYFYYNELKSEIVQVNE